MSEARKSRGSTSPHMRHINLRRIASYINENLKVAAALADYLNELASTLEQEYRIMSQHGKNVNTIIDRLQAADAEVARLNSINAQQTTQLSTLQNLVPDQEDQTADARLDAVLAGKPDPGDPAAQQPAAPQAGTAMPDAVPVDQTTQPATVGVTVPEAAPPAPAA